MVDRTKKLPARFYVNPVGGIPVREWLLALTDADRRMIGKDIQKVEFGWPIGRPHCAPLSDQHRCAHAQCPGEPADFYVNVSSVVPCLSHHDFS